MRPLLHPSIEDITVEGILHVLSDPVRVAIFTDIAMSNCSQNCTNFASIGDRSIPKSTLSQHFKALREAGLIRSERHGVEMQNVSRCSEVDERFPGLLASILKAYTEQIAAQKSAGKASRRKAVRRVAQ
ncbi:ArsR/SmtB family transcription factor [Granulicella aggregans]|jgi:DNA-binding transcriptional ArsR family regulator|uniref:ArsR/SmtB family transcription factor n=1 Tax=Granulicella aggregans TaxID=474949 RepID=UPI0021E06C06|nr:helix-turn-helix domain-containing protein [Granulicella aggregans]